MAKQEKFSVVYEGKVHVIDTYLINNELIYKIHFPDKRQPLLIVRSAFAGGESTWSSLQDNRENEVAQFGKLIDAHLSGGDS
ncbi:hypothetical protein C7T94_13705 [Pedobacter yulinensis]|uniref:Uncharacterized protein n=1 Tax=Pedobacter yulinensis TaxID=2126353 RepID=A0A2T3HMA8_9SPHI|nr:hypothetical protein [Pedobacter yulinensis]PST83592.1 hypothetical protein C7T94_13705 [Pedobacter yulinensis]